MLFSFQRISSFDIQLHADKLLYWYIHIINQEYWTKDVLHINADMYGCIHACYHSYSNIFILYYNLKPNPFVLTMTLIWCHSIYLYTGLFMLYTYCWEVCSGFTWDFGWARIQQTFGTWCHLDLMFENILLFSVFFIPYLLNIHTWYILFQLGTPVASTHVWSSLYSPCDRLFSYAAPYKTLPRVFQCT